MTENELREKVVAQARAWLNKNEADGSHRAILNVYNAIEPLPRGYRMTASDPWCAAFVSAVGAACGLTDIIFPECACDPMRDAYKAAGRWIGDCHYAAQPGDVIFYDWGNDGSSDHVGIVESSGASYYQVIEGNYSDAVKRRVVMHGYEHIVGFGLPDYASKANVSETPTGSMDCVGHDGTGEDSGTPGRRPLRPRKKTEENALKKYCVLNLPVLRYGDGVDDPDETVRAAQLLLIGRSFRCGAAGADGEFGDKTQKAVVRFQRGYNLAVDGVIGPDTWAALLGVR